MNVSPSGGAGQLESRDGKRDYKQKQNENVTWDWKQQGSEGCSEKIEREEEDDHLGRNLNAIRNE